MSLSLNTRKKQQPVPKPFKIPTTLRPKPQNPFETYQPNLLKTESLNPSFVRRVIILIEEGHKP